MSESDVQKQMGEDKNILAEGEAYRIRQIFLKGPTAAMTGRQWKGKQMLSLSS